MPGASSACYESVDKLDAMSQPSLILVASLFGCSAFAQVTGNSDFKLALPNHSGQLRLFADGFEVIQTSAKPNGREIGLRCKDKSGRLTFLEFLFVFPEQAPLTSSKCRDGVLGPTMKSNPDLKIVASSETIRPNDLPVAYATYTVKARSGSPSYVVRAFIATGDLCGDLEFYSEQPISADDADLKKIFASYQLDLDYLPRFSDIFVYAQLLYKAQAYKEAAPMFEAALVKLKDEPSAATRDGVRILNDQAGMSYGMSGQIAKARKIFEKAIIDDPDYPLYYYNLACADAEEKKLSDARLHLQQAFARKGNIISGETMPDPTKDDSFTPFRDNKDFWKFLEGLQAHR